jgi:hypothetical protein
VKYPFTELDSRYGHRAEEQYRHLLFQVEYKCLREVKDPTLRFFQAVLNTQDLVVDELLKAKPQCAVDWLERVYWPTCKKYSRKERHAEGEGG